MEYWDKVKALGVKTKLRGEMAFHEREVIGRKKQFGIELYDLLTNDKNKLLGVTAGTIFKALEGDMKEPFEKARDEVLGVQARKDVKQKELDVLDADAASTLPDQTLEQKAKKAGKVVTSGAVGTKLRAEMALLDREMKIRKEQLGLAVFDLVKDSNVAGTEGNLSPDETDIQACIDVAKSDVAKFEGTIQTKQREVGLLDSEMQPLQE